MLPSRFRRPLVFGVNQFTILEHLLLHYRAVVSVSGQRAVAWRGAELYQLVAAEDVGVCAFLAVVAVKVLDNVFIVAFADQLAMEAAFDCAVAGYAVRIKIGYDLFFCDADTVRICVFGGFGFVQADRDVDGCTQTNMAADAGADAQADGNAGCADCTCAE